MTSALRTEFVGGRMTQLAPARSPTLYLVSSVRVRIVSGEREHVEVFARGQPAGKLVVGRGEAHAIAHRLLTAGLEPDEGIMCEAVDPFTSIFYPSSAGRP